MDNLSYTVEGLQEMEKAIQELANEYSAKEALSSLRLPLRKSIAIAKQTAQQKVPVDSGVLKESLKVSVKKPSRRDRRSQHVDKDTVLVARLDAKPYKQALAVEFGTSQVSAQPFLRPSLEDNVEEIFRVFTTELSKNISKSAKRLNKKYNKGGR
jgi:HK97 gp10 family phage protein